MPGRLGRLAAALAVAAVALDVAAPAGQSQVSVGRNVLVSRGEPDAVHYEVLLAAHPSDPKQLLACTQLYDPNRNKNANAVYVSTDEGLTWKATLKTDDFDQTGDPSCSYGVDGAAYHVTLAQSFSSRQWGGVEPSRLSIPVYRSKDGGHTWQVAAALNTSSTANDREWVVVDQTTGPYRGQVYLASTVWTLGTGTWRERAVALYRSRDGGSTFEGPVTRTTERPGFAHVPSNAVVLSDGAVIFAFTELKDSLSPEGIPKPREPGSTSNAALKAVASRDGGESLEPPVRIDDVSIVMGPVGASIPTLAVDPGSVSFKDRLYVVWSDTRSGRSDVLLAHSDDRARTWSSPVVVNDDEPRATALGEPYLPTVAVNRDGVVGVLWYDRRENPTTLGYCPRFGASLDGGVTFLPSVRVADVCATVGEDERWPVWAQGTVRPPTGGPLRINVWVFPRFYTGADTAGLAADAAGRFHALWVDNRTGLPQVWTAPITVTGSVRRSGSQTLESLDDVTAKVALEVTATHYDRATRHARIDLRLRNVSTAILSAPLRVRLVTLASRLGAVRITNQDSGPDHAGAELDFTPTLERGVLKPQERTKSRPLIFELSNVKPFYAGGRSFTPGLILSDFRVYASRTRDPTAASRR